jgi:hypothetical protein
LKDGTNLSVTQISEAGNGTAKYTVNVDRYAVFATLDGNPVGQDAAATGLSTVKIGGILTNEQTSLGTVAFVGGKNIDSLSRDAFGTPQFDTQFKIDASGGSGSGWGQTNNGGVVQFTLKSTDMTAYSSAGQTYANNQDGSATSQLASYNVDLFDNEPIEQEMSAPGLCDPLLFVSIVHPDAVNTCAFMSSHGASLIGSSLTM